MVPLTRELDPTAGPLDFFGAEVRRWRIAAGLSQEQLGQNAFAFAITFGDRFPAAGTCQPTAGSTVREIDPTSEDK